MDTDAIYVYGICWHYWLFGEGSHLPDNSVPFEVSVKREEQNISVI